MRIALIDKVAVTRQGIGEILKRHFRLEVLGGYDGLDEDIDWSSYDLAIVNCCLGQSGQLDSFSQLKEGHPDLPVLCLVREYDLTLFASLRKVRVDGVVSITSEEGVIVSAVRALQKGTDYYMKTASVRSVLTRREWEILSLVVEGLSNQEVADRLFISEKTVKNHLSAIFRKIGVKSRSQAVRYAFDHGLLST